jgi:hypothetical protein
MNETISPVVSTETLILFILAMTQNVKDCEILLEESTQFKNVNTPHGLAVAKSVGFKSATLTTAFNQVRNARMMCGDLLRLLGVEKPYSASYEGKGENEKPQYLEKNLITVKSIDELTDAENEFEALAEVRTKLAKAGYAGGPDSGVFYELVENFAECLDVYKKEYKPSAGRLTEFRLYYSMLLEALKIGNCNLGLRYGEIVK